MSQETTQDAQGGLSVSIISTDSGFLALRDESNELVEKDERATVFQTWEFQYHARRMLSETVSLHLVLVRDETGVWIGCAPWVTCMGHWAPGGTSAGVRLRTVIATTPSS